MLQERSEDAAPWCSSPAWSLSGLMSDLCGIAVAIVTLCEDASLRLTSTPPPSQSLRWSKADTYLACAKHSLLPSQVYIFTPPHLVIPGHLLTFVYAPLLAFEPLHLNTTTSHLPLIESRHSPPFTHSPFTPGIASQTSYKDALQPPSLPLPSLSPHPTTRFSVASICSWSVRYLPSQVHMDRTAG